MQRIAQYTSQLTDISQLTDWDVTFENTLTGTDGI